MKIIKGVLEEELKNFLRMQEEYETALAALPRGALVKKFVKGHQYYYLMMREGSKVRFEYKGKLLGKEIKFYNSISWRDHDDHAPMPILSDGASPPGLDKMASSIIVLACRSKS